MLEIRGLHKIYGKYHALSGLDMTVETGALYGFVGPNGAGKTTTIKIMTGLLEAEEGRITINGMDARADLGKLKSMIGYVPDPRTRFEFREILKELQESGKTIVISSHVLSELSELCTDIGIIDQGRMVLEGNIDDILSRVNTSNPLVISVFTNIDKALSILKSHPCVQTISLREQDICVRFAGDAQDEALLLQRLIDSDVLVNGFTREKGSLESVFMQLTEHEEERVVLSYDAKSGL